MVGAGLSKLPCLGFLVLALLTHSSVAMKPSKELCNYKSYMYLYVMSCSVQYQVNDGNVEVCRQGTNRCSQLITHTHTHTHTKGHVYRGDRELGNH